MHLNKGLVIAGRYEVIEKIGSGGMSIVYRANDRKLNRSVTLKVLREEHLNDEDFVKRFQVEAKAVASLSHANIVNVFDYGNEDNVFYIVMEYINGVTLKSLINDKAPFRDTEALGVAIQIAEALQHAHANGVIHRDIKPQNILVTKNGIVKVTDFGIARTLLSETVNSDSTMGSVQYFSPEQAKGANIDGRSDLYSLGIVMFEMLTGELPFDGEEAVAVALMHINDELPDISGYNPEVSDKIIEIVRKMTEKKLSARYQSTSEVLYDLKKRISNIDSSIDISKLNLTESSFNNGFFGGDSEDYDEDFDPEKERKEKKTELLVVFSAVFTSIIVIALALLFIVIPILKKPAASSDEVEVPNIVELQFEDGKTALEEIGLLIEIAGEEFSEEFEAGVILEQDHVDGYVEKEPASKVIVSKGTAKIAVPDLTNIEVLDAYKRVEDQKLAFIVRDSYENSDTVPMNIVIRQEPEAASLAEQGSEIIIYVSKGPELKTVIVPSLLGMTQDKAIKALTDLGLKPGNVGYEESSEYSKGQVVSQTIEGGKEAMENTVVSFDLSSGPPAVTESPKPSDIETKDQLLINNINFMGKERVVIKVVKKVGDDYTEIYTKEINPSDLPILLDVSGTGTVEYILYVDGVETASDTKVFD